MPTLRFPSDRPYLSLPDLPEGVNAVVDASGKAGPVFVTRAGATFLLTTTREFIQEAAYPLTFTVQTEPDISPLYLA